jgi:hypothetical protein
MSYGHGSRWQPLSSIAMVEDMPPKMAHFISIVFS